MSDDLSEYERRRFENIQRNNAFLASLGFDAVNDNAAKRSRSDEPKKGSPKGIKRQRSKQEVFMAALPRRRSPRLLSLPATEAKILPTDVTETEEESSPDYSTTAYGTQSAEI